MAFKDLSKPRPPYKHPPVEPGWTRVELPEIQGETKGAGLFNFKDPSLKNNGLIWIPKSCYRIRWGGGLHPEDEESVLDIKTWFYEKEIER